MIKKRSPRKAQKTEYRAIRTQQAKGFPVKQTPVIPAGMPEPLEREANPAPWTVTWRFCRYLSNAKFYLPVSGFRHPCRNDGLSQTQVYNGFGRLRMNAGYDAVSGNPIADSFRAFRTFRGQCVTSVIKVSLLRRYLNRVPSRRATHSAHPCASPFGCSACKSAILPICPAESSGVRCGKREKYGPCVTSVNNR